MARYEVKPVALVTSDADKSGLTCMVFPGVKIRAEGKM